MPNFMLKDDFWPKLCQKHNIMPDLVTLVCVPIKFYPLSLTWNLAIKNKLRPMSYYERYFANQIRNVKKNKIQASKKNNVAIF